MNFGYVTVNGVDSNVAGLHAIVDWIVCIIYGITTERKKKKQPPLSKAASIFLTIHFSAKQICKDLVCGHIHISIRIRKRTSVPSQIITSSDIITR